MSERTQAIWDGLQCDPAECKGCINQECCVELGSEDGGLTLEQHYGLREIIHLRKMIQRLESQLDYTESLLDEVYTEWSNNNIYCLGGIDEELMPKISEQQSSRQARGSWSLYTSNK